LEEGESRTEALRREIREETGIENLVRVIEDLYYFEFSDPNPNQEYVYGVEVSPTEQVVFDRKEHNEYRWCGIKDAFQLLSWKENKEALEKLNTIWATKFSYSFSAFIVVLVGWGRVFSSCLLLLTPFSLLLVVHVLIVAVGTHHYEEGNYKHESVDF